MKRTVVIHPKDKSTEFLSRIYKDKKDWTIKRDRINSYDVKEESDLYINTIVDNFDRIILLGHGGPSGLFYSHFSGMSYNNINKLKDKEFITIFCNSDSFLNYTDLYASMYSGMFISEVGEAYAFNIEASQKQVDYSNNLFGDVAGACIDMMPEERHEYIKANYNSDTDQVIRFNNRRLYEKNIYDSQTAKEDKIFKFFRRYNNI